MRQAAKYGRLAIVKLLIPVSDPQAGDSLALRQAAQNGRVECVMALLPHSDGKQVRKKLAHDGNDDAVALLDAVMQAAALKAKHARPSKKRRTPRILGVIGLAQESLGHEDLPIQKQEEIQIKVVVQCETHGTLFVDKDGADWPVAD